MAEGPRSAAEEGPEVNLDGTGGGIAEGAGRWGGAAAEGGLECGYAAEEGGNGGLRGGPLIFESTVIFVMLAAGSAIWGTRVVGVDMRG